MFSMWTKLSHVSNKILQPSATTAAHNDPWGEFRWKMSGPVIRSSDILKPPQLPPQCTSGTQDRNTDSQRQSGGTCQKNDFSETRLLYGLPAGSDGEDHKGQRACGLILASILLRMVTHSRDLPENYSWDREPGTASMDVKLTWLN